MALAQTPSSRNKANLVRLLRSCESLSASLSVSAPAQSRADRRRFETYLTVLQRQWQELAVMLVSADCLRVPADERLAELLDADKMVTGSGAALARRRHTARQPHARANKEIVNRLQTTCMQEAVRSQLLQSTGGGAGAGAALAQAAAAQQQQQARRPSTTISSRGCRAPSAGALRPARCSRRKKNSSLATAQALKRATAQRRLWTSRPRRAGSRGSTPRRRRPVEQRELHDTLLADLADSVGQLRDRSLQARSAVRDDLRLRLHIDQLDGNRAKLDENNTRLRTTNACAARRA